MAYRQKMSNKQYSREARKGNKTHGYNRPRLYRGGFRL